VKLLTAFAGISVPARPGAVVLAALLLLLLITTIEHTLYLSVQ